MYLRTISIKIRVQKNSSRKKDEMKARVKDNRGLFFRVVKHLKEKSEIKPFLRVEETA